MGIEITANQFDATERRTIRAFLNVQLVWLNKQCLTFSRLAASGDTWSIMQYRYFRTYRSNVKHLIHLAEKPIRSKKPRQRKAK